MNNKMIALALATASVFASCKKEDAPSPSPTPSPKPAPSSAAATPSYGTGDGALVALITRTTMSTPLGPVSQDLGTGVAVFGNLSTGTYNDAGTITLNGKELKKQTNNSYVYIPGTTDVTGIDLSDNIKWSVASPVISYDASLAGSGRDMPSSGGLSGSYTTIDASSAFTLSVVSVLNADSVYFQINGPDKSILKRRSGTTTSVTFTADEVASLGKSQGCSVTVAPWNHQEKTFGGKLVHVINELALSRVVEIK